MRYVLISYCVLATACAGDTPTAPSSSLSPVGATRAAATNAGDSTAVVRALGGSASPFKGTLEAIEEVNGSLHHLVGTGNGTHLGRFTYAADITVDDATGDAAGTVTWTAANGGDQIFASTTGGIILADFPHGRITIGETQIITGGTDRFIGASGTINVERSLDLLTGLTAGSYTGTINTH